ncbi:hypothetical protein ONZ45_g5684 [Pleurotus djamor]|nr:hypothetical protein ONZ45_g5684 [Pleurotus djamor]
MFAFRTFVVTLAAAATIVAKPLQSRQTTNTNAQIQQVIDSLDESIHIIMPNILTLQAQEAATDATVQDQVNELLTVFNASTNDFKIIPVSSGSTTGFPTNDDISIFFADILQQVATGLSGLNRVPGLDMLSTFMANLDPVIASSIRALNTTLPGSINLVHTMMLDAQQFLTSEGLTKSRTALGFT